jgi:hypothetical protein
LVDGSVVFSGTGPAAIASEPFFPSAAEVASQPVCVFVGELVESRKALLFADETLLD